MPLRGRNRCTAQDNARSLATEASRRHTGQNSPSTVLGTKTRAACPLGETQSTTTDDIRAGTTPHAASEAL